jgi:hypothetical protein
MISDCTPPTRGTQSLPVLRPPFPPCPPPSAADQAHRRPLSQERYSSRHRAADWLISTVQRLGYDGDDLLGLDPDQPGAFNFEGVEFLAECKHEEHNGRTREKWSLIEPGQQRNLFQAGPPPRRPLPPPRLWGTDR